MYYNILNICVLTDIQSFISIFSDISYKLKILSLKFIHIIFSLYRYYKTYININV